VNEKKETGAGSMAQAVLGRRDPFIKVIHLAGDVCVCVCPICINISVKRTAMN
jgi:hypothetical protein